MTIRAIIAAAALLASSALAQAQNPEAPTSFTVISPVFSQLVSFSMPSHFVAGYEKATDANYTREAVPKGETLTRWSEMITVTGARGLASAPNASAENFAATMANGFKKVCPDSFAAQALGATRIGGNDTYAAVVGCGRIKEGDQARSETALIIAIKGAADIYTVQWAERGAAADKADVGNAKWQERLKKLSPLRVCPIVPGEASPYPSCIGKS